METKDLSHLAEVKESESEKVNGGFYFNLWGANNTYFGAGSGSGAAYRNYNPNYNSGYISGNGSIYDSIYTYYA